MIGVLIQKFSRTTDYKRKETLRNFDKSQRPWKVITVEEYLATRSGDMPNKIEKQLQYPTSDAFVIRRNSLESDRKPTRWILCPNNRLNTQPGMFEIDLPSVPPNSVLRRGLQACGSVPPGDQFRRAATDTTNHEQVRMQWQMFCQWIRGMGCLQDAPMGLSFDEELTPGGTPVLPALESMAQDPKVKPQKEAAYAPLDEVDQYPDTIKAETLAVVAAFCSEHIGPDNMDKSGFFDQ